MRRNSLRRLLSWIGRLLLLLRYRVEVRGLEHLPPGGPLLIVANHFGWLEPALLPVLLPYNIEFLAGDNVFDVKRCEGFIVLSQQAVLARIGGALLHELPRGSIHPSITR